MYWDLNARSTTVGMTKLVHESLRPFSFFHYPLSVVLANGSGELVVVHGWSIFSQAPTSCDAHAVFNFENSTSLIQPLDTTVRLLSKFFQQLFQKLPEVNVGSTF